MQGKTVRRPALRRSCLPRRPPGAAPALCGAPLPAPVSCPRLAGRPGRLTLLPALSGCASMFHTYSCAASVCVTTTCGCCGSSRMRFTSPGWMTVFTGLLT